MKKKNNWVMKNWYFILIPIFIILLSFAEIHYLNKPDYKITKEVCGNQEILIPDNLTLIGYTEEPFVSEFEVNISNPDFKVKYKFIGQVCETQEVENIFGIELITDKWFYPNRDGKEWLKENCGCIDKPYGMSVCKWDVPDDCIIDRSITGLYTVNSSRPECLNCGQEDVFPEDCTKFKCGEYQVEVLR